MQSNHKLAVLTSGGDAPGMNAAVRAVIRAAHYNKVEIFGCYSGFDGLIHNKINPLTTKDVSGIIHRGGTILGSARSEAFRTTAGRQTAAENLRNLGITGLIIIGGDGSFTGGTLLASEHNISIVGVPGTIDNDLYGTDYTIGFDTAVNTVVESIDKIRDTAASHKRVFFVEVMGRDSGYIALNAAVACGAEDVFIPEFRSDIASLEKKLNERFHKNQQSSIVVVAEGDELGGAKEVAEMVQKHSTGLDVRFTILGHVQRGGSPTMRDRILASRMGAKAVEWTLNGTSDVMTGVQNGCMVQVPIVDAIEKTKKLSPDLLVLNDILAT